MHDLSEQLVRKIILSLEKVIDESEGPFYAAFDADGTLWDTDIGENFFHYQIENRLVENLPPDPWEHYLKLKKEISPPAAYLWLAQINRGHSLEEVRAWSQECNKKGPAIPYLKGQKKIISFLHSKKVNVYVVSASIKWAIEPAAAIFDIPQERCLGVKTKIDPKGIITDIQDGPITWKKGKVEGLMLATHGVSPIFASGNTPGDLALLEAATHHRLTIAGSKENQELYADELSLAEEAKKRGWFCHLP